MWDTRSRVLRVIDGDTLEVESDLGRSVRHTATVRLLGVWAPELSEFGGPETLAYVHAWVETRAAGKKWPFLLVTQRTRDEDSDKKTFDRWVGTLSTLDGSECLNVEIMEFVRANGYGGGVGS